MKTTLCLAGCVLAAAAFAASPDPVRTRALLGVIQSEAGLPERARALQQLALVASPEAVPVLAGLLGDARLGQYARDGLELIPDPAASAALRAALDRLGGHALIGVVNSLGVRRDPAAVPALRKLAADPASVAAPAALVALGRIGGTEATAVLTAALAQGQAERRAAAAEGCLLAAEREVAGGRGTEARRLRDLVRAAEVPRPLRLAATRGVILAGGDEAVPLLLAQLRSDDPDFHDLALRAARDLASPAVVPSLLAALDGLDPGRQAAVMAVLEDRGEPAALPALEARVGGGDGLVRLAALRALGTLGQASSLPLLLKAAAAVPAEPGTEVALASLARIRVAETNQALLRALPAVPPAAQVRLIAVLGERQAEAATTALIGWARGPDPAVAQAALRALGQVAVPADLPRLIALALVVADEEARTLADRAIVTTAMRLPEPARRSAAVLEAFVAATDPAAKAALLRPLGAIQRAMGGNHDVFLAVQAALKHPDGGVRAAALRCLADWPDAAPTTTLLAWAAGKDVPVGERETALLGAIRMATNVAAGRERSPLDLAAAFTAAQRLVRSRPEKLAIVSALGNWKRPETLALLEPYLDDPEVKAEAALALVQVAPALAGAKAAGRLPALLARVAASAPEEDTRRKAARLAKGGPGPAPKGKGKAATAPAGAPAATRPPLFNGTDLAGWDGDPGVWRVREGTIVGGSLAGNPRNEFLAMTRRTGNFVLRLEYRLTGTAGFVNGGVQFRSVRIAQPPNEMSGYQADIGAGHSGCLYDESRRKKFLQRAPDDQIRRLERVGEWNRYEIRCSGPRVEISLNGERTVAYVEEDATVEREGLIALQIHGNCKAEIAFRNLVLEELP